MRANLADIALAALAPITLFAFFANRTRLKEIAGPRLLVLLAAATLLLSFSLFRGYEAISGLSSWAALKYAGWYILIYYLSFGVLIAIVAPPAGNERFALGFFCFQIVLILAFIAIEYMGFTSVIDLGGALTGFAGNPNAMAFYLICGFALALAYMECTGFSLRRRRAVFIAAGILLAGLLFTRSIAALIAITSVLMFAAIIRAATLKRLLQVVALGLSLWMTPQVIAAPPSLVVNIFHKMFGIVRAAGTADPRDRAVTQYNATIQLRIEGYLEALAMWQAYPVFGAGLGVHLHHQKLDEKPKILVLQIHNTALWLLAETGLAGFLVMAAIFVVLFHKVWSLARSPPDEPGSGVWFQSAVLLILVGWGVMSLFHELMYQRVVWLLVGMALTAPVEPLSLWKRDQARKSDTQQ